MKLYAFASLFAAFAALSLLSSASLAQQDNQWGSLSGTVTFDGTPPPPESLEPAMQMHADKACCLAGTKFEKVTHKWIVDAKSNGVAAVAVYLKAPMGQSFPIHAEDKARKGVVTVDQPHCAFLPHMVAHFPSYNENGQQVPTGEKFLVKNSATVGHNIRGTGNPLKNPGFNFNLPPGTQKEVALVPQNLPVLLQCDIHPWMNAKAFVFDHPYFAITKEDGSFSIPRVPVGAQVSVMAWHEEIGYVFGKDGKSIAIQPGANKLDFKVKAPEAK